MHEIVTLQFGRQSNYLGTHFWNTQVRAPPKHCFGTLLRGYGIRLGVLSPCLEFSLNAKRANARSGLQPPCLPCGKDSPLTQHQFDPALATDVFYDADRVTGIVLHLPA
jgi:hypothetical protein